MLTGFIPVIIDFGTSRISVPNTVVKVMDEVMEAETQEPPPEGKTMFGLMYDWLANYVNSVYKTEEAPVETPVEAPPQESRTDIFATDFSTWGPEHGYTNKYNRAYDIYMVIGGIMDYMLKAEESQIHFNMLHETKDAAFINEYMRFVEKIYNRLRSRVPHVIEGPIQHRLSLIPGTRFYTDYGSDGRRFRSDNFDDHDIQDLNGLTPMDVVQIIAEMFPQVYERITTNRTALRVPVEALVERYSDLSCVAEAEAAKRKTTSTATAQRVHKRRRV